MTGASSGIGSEFARPIAQRRLNVEMTAGNGFGEWLRFHKDGEKVPPEAFGGAPTGRQPWRRSRAHEAGRGRGSPDFRRCGCGDWYRSAFAPTFAEASADKKASADTPTPKRLRLSGHFVACHPKPKA